jgi:putative hemolysin
MTQVLSAAASVWFLSLVASCATTQSDDTPRSAAGQEPASPAQRPAESEAPNTAEAVQLANPASEHCEKRGGRLERVKDEHGNESGYCVFPDGTRCEEWALFRGQCQAGTQR